MRCRDSIYVVAFKEAPVEGDTRRTFFFTSIAAIYARFSAEVMGFSIQSLYNRRVGDGRAYVGKKCTVKREPLGRSHRRSDLKRMLRGE